MGIMKIERYINHKTFKKLCRLRISSLIGKFLLQKIKKLF